MKRSGHPDRRRDRHDDGEQRGPDEKTSREDESARSADDDADERKIGRGTCEILHVIRDPAMNRNSGEELERRAGDGGQLQSADAPKQVVGVFPGAGARRIKINRPINDFSLSRERVVAHACAAADGRCRGMPGERGEECRRDGCVPDAHLAEPQRTHAIGDGTTRRRSSHLERSVELIFRHRRLVETIP